MYLLRVSVIKIEVNRVQSYSFVTANVCNGRCGGKRVYRSTFILHYLHFVKSVAKCTFVNELCKGEKKEEKTHLRER